MDLSREPLFSEVNTDMGWAIPTPAFWELWNSQLRHNIKRAGYRPKPDGEAVGVSEKWIVWLPRYPAVSTPMGYRGDLGTSHISVPLFEFLNKLSSIG